MRIFITGSSGLVGSALIPFLTAAGHQPRSIVRKKTRPTDVQWDPESGVLDHYALEGADAVVHLAGENIAARRWSAAQKSRIRDSRVRGTRLISEALTRLSTPPSVLVSASAVGFYGNRGTELLREEANSGQGFLADVCRQWEGATDSATRKGIRVVHLRTGLVLSAKGGALAKMITPFKFGVGGRVGSGQQYWSWITLDDLCGAILHSIQASTLHGAVNAVSPRPVTNIEFTQTLGRVLSRPTIFPLPSFVARLVLGEMADELLLSSARVEPAKLVATRYSFRQKELEPALRQLVGQ